MDGEVDSGVENGDALLTLSQALVERDEKEIKAARARIVAEMGYQALVDAIGVASNFERMVRIADATGIELGEFLENASANVRSELGVRRMEGWED